MLNLEVVCLAQEVVIGSMLIDDRCVPLVMSRMREEDFTDPTCRNFFRVIREMAMEGSRVDPVPVLGRLKNGDDYIGWARDVMAKTPTAANVGEYISMAREYAAISRFYALCRQGLECTDMEQVRDLACRMPATLSAAERMPRMTGPEMAKDFLARMDKKEKPKYLPWGIPTADRNIYAELGDMILLGGRASSGKTLLSILMAMAQAKAGYKVGYYSLETRPKKMADRMFSSLAKVPLEKIKTRSFDEEEWPRLADAANCVATVCPYDIIQAAKSTVDDIVSDAIGHGYQIIYVDYVQLIRPSGRRDVSDYSRVTAVSQDLKTFAQSTNTAVVALAQLSRPSKDEKWTAPNMYSFKDSGQLEQDADAALLIWAADPDDNSSNRMFKIAKNKEGHRPRAVELVFHGDTQTMVELERPDRSVAAELSAQGRAIKQANRAAARRAQFQELKSGDEDNPFAEE